MLDQLSKEAYGGQQFIQEKSKKIAYSFLYQENIKRHKYLFALLLFFLSNFDKIIF